MLPLATSYKTSTNSGVPANRYTNAVADVESHAAVAPGTIDATLSMAQIDVETWQNPATSNKHHDNTVKLPRPRKYPAAAFNFDFVKTTSTTTSTLFLALFTSSSTAKAPPCEWLQHPPPPTLFFLSSSGSQFSSSSNSELERSLLIVVPLLVFSAAISKEDKEALFSFPSNIPACCKKSLSSFEMS